MSIINDDITKFSNSRLFNPVYIRSAISSNPNDILSGIQKYIMIYKTIIKNYQTISSLLCGSIGFKKIW